MTAFLSVCLILALLAILFLWRSCQTRVHALNNQIENEIQEKQQIISIVSHDIKSPFTRISALEQLITMDDNKLSSSQQDYLNKIHQVVADGLSLIRNLVDYRNLEYRRIEIIPEPIDLSQLTLAAVRRVQTLGEKKELVFNCDIEPDILITSDNSFVNRAIDNVLSNAIKFSTNSKTIEVSLKRENGHNFIKVKDEAEGFTAEDMKNLFRKFQRFSAKPTAGESTTGLGLYITKSMLDKIGGKIQCVTKEGAGSTFIIDLPTQLPVKN